MGDEAPVTSDDLLVLNGVDADTGAYLTPPVRLAEVAATVRAQPDPALRAPELLRRTQAREAHLGVAYGRDPDELGSVGWGVVVPDGFDPAALEALRPLLDLRREQAGERYKQLEVRRGEEKDDFLARYGMGPSVADPRRVPYYLLLLGTPAQVSFEFQYQLGVTYAVGRLDLPDADAYATYCATVVAGEKDPVGRSDAGRQRSVHLFGPRHPDDRPTELSTTWLVEPLGADLREETSAWQVTQDVGESATRSRLEELVVGAQGPDILFTAGHGLGSARRGGELAGALVCQDWPGPRGRTGPVDDAYYLAGHHLPARSTVVPRVVMAFACFGAGTPEAGTASAPRRARAAAATASHGAFTARLPQALLSSTSGGALAFVGHVGRAWACSFLWKTFTAQVTPFSSTLLALMDGARLGWAMESLSARYAEVATELTHRMDASRTYGRTLGDADLVGLWTAAQDARAYVVLGDPAVRAAPRGSALLPGR